MLNIVKFLLTYFWAKSTQFCCTNISKSVQNNGTFKIFAKSFTVDTVVYILYLCSVLMKHTKIIKYIFTFLMRYKTVGNWGCKIAKKNLRGIWHHFSCLMSLKYQTIPTVAGFWRYRLDSKANPALRSAALKKALWDLIFFHIFVISILSFCRPF